MKDEPTKRQAEALAAAAAIVAAGRPLTMEALGQRLEISDNAARGLRGGLHRKGLWPFAEAEREAVRRPKIGRVVDPRYDRKRTSELNRLAATWTIDEWIEYTRPLIQGVR